MIHRYKLKLTLLMEDDGSVQDWKGDIETVAIAGAPDLVSKEEMLLTAGIDALNVRLKEIRDEKIRISFGEFLSEKERQLAP